MAFFVSQPPSITSKRLQHTYLIEALIYLLDEVVETIITSFDQAKVLCCHVHISDLIRAL